MTGMALVELNRGNAEIADDFVRWSIAISEAAPYTEALLEAQILRGRTLIALNMVEEGLNLLHHVQTRARDLGARSLQAQARRALNSYPIP
jgi:hypothetical protein